MYFVVFHYLLLMIVFVNHISTFHDGGRRTNASFLHNIMKRQTVRPCTLPTLTSERTFSIVDTNSKVLKPSSGMSVPSRSELRQTCSTGFSLENGENNLDSICSSKGVWTPPLKPCYKTCDLTQRRNVELTKCERNEQIVKCDGVFLNGTKVFPKCKSLYKEEYKPKYTYIQCKNDGGWSKPLIECVPICGQTRSAVLISNGNVAKLSDFPWQVAIYEVSKKYLLICGGTLISRTIVISAAHCFYEESTGKNKFNKPHDYEVVTGKVTRAYNITDNIYQKAFKIQRLITTTKAYDPKSTGHYGSDIIIIILEKPVDYNLYVLPACMNWRDTEFEPGNTVKGVVSGWGSNSRGYISEILYYTSLPFVSYNDCKKKLQGLTNDKFCAGNITGPKPQSGDSGGGLLFKDKDDLYYLRGIVSTADKFADISIVAFTDVSSFINWIYEIYEQEKTKSESATTTQPNTPTTEIAFNKENTCSKLNESPEWSCNKRSTCPNDASKEQIVKCGVEEETGEEKICCAPPTYSRIIEMNEARKIECGKSKKNDWKIVNFRNSSLGSWPWMAAIMNQGESSLYYLFGGSLISDQWVLTAAHKVTWIQGQRWKIVVRLGDLDVDDEVLDNLQGVANMDVQDYIVHPQFEKSPLKNDIALIRLKKKVQFTENIRPICLLRDATQLSNDYYDRKNATIVGWGSTVPGEIESTRLQEINLFGTSFQKCSQAFPKSTEITIDQTVFCTEPRSVDACDGYGGSPVILRDPVEKTFYQGGIVTFGSRNCAKGVPRVHVKIPAYVGWIDNELKKYGDTILYY